MSKVSSPSEGMAIGPSDTDCYCSRTRAQAIFRFVEYDWFQLQCRDIVSIVILTQQNTSNRKSRWTALSGVFIVGVTSGGPPVMVFSFIGVSFLTLAVAIPMAEMCSMYPVAGGQYSWVSALSPPRFARGLSYVTGWFMLIGIAPFPTPFPTPFHEDMLTTSRYLGHGCNEQFHCLQLCPWNGKLGVPRI